MQNELLFQRNFFIVKPSPKPRYLQKINIKLARQSLYDKIDICLLMANVYIRTYTVTKKDKIINLFLFWCNRR